MWDAMLLITVGGYMLYEPTVIHFHEALLRLVHVYILGLRPVSETTVHSGSFKPPYAVAISLATVLKPAEMRKKVFWFLSSI